MILICIMLLKSLISGDVREQWITLKRVKLKKLLKYVLHTFRMYF